jgi:hypothetical protein
VIKASDSGKRHSRRRREDVVRGVHGLRVQRAPQAPCQKNEGDRQDRDDILGHGGEHCSELIQRHRAMMRAAVIMRGASLRWFMTQRHVGSRRKVTLPGQLGPQFTVAQADQRRIHEQRDQHITQDVDSPTQRARLYKRLRLPACRLMCAPPSGTTHT